MNEFRPTVGIEFDDKYIEARSKLIDFIKALNDLTAWQKECLAKEYLVSIGMAAAFEQFMNYINGGGQF